MPVSVVVDRNIAKTKAARTAPGNGPAMYTQRCRSSGASSAGARLRAGLRLVPVKGGAQMQDTGSMPPGQPKSCGGGEGAEDLRGDVTGEIMRMHFALGPGRHGDGWVQMCAAAPSDRAEGHEATGAGEHQAG